MQTEQLELEGHSRCVSPYNLEEDMYLHTTLIV